MASPNQPQFLDIQVQGLYLNPSTFGNNAPPGALTIADNVVIDRPSVVATRRGFDNTFAVIDTTAILSQFQYNNTKILHNANHQMMVDLLGNGSYAAYSGTFDVPSTLITGSRIRGVEVNKNFYFITQNGTYRLDHTAGEPRLAGAPPGLSGTGAPIGTTGFLPNNTRVAYRVVFGFTDYNQQLVLGAPSSRIIVTNTGGTSANAILTFQIPKEIQASPADWIFQVYRGSASPDLATEPDDAMSLVYEDICNSLVTPIIGGEITITDITPDSLKGAYLYTNNSQDGILQSNYRPPWAEDICVFKQYAFYANTRTLQNANLTLIAAGASNGSNAMVQIGRAHV